MKLRYVIFILSALALLNGCGKEVNMQAGQEEGTSPILFSATAPDIQAHTKTFDPSDVTRPNDPTTLIGVGNSVSVFGVWIPDWAVQTTYEQQFYNRNLRCDAVYDLDPSDSMDFDPENQNSSLWNYTPLVYWKDTGHYVFLAISPYTAADFSLGDEYPYPLSISYRVGTNQDLMAARAYRNRNSEGKDRVQLQFHHLTSAVRFLFCTATDEGDAYTITGFHLENFSPRGTLTLSSRLTSAIDPSTIGSEGGWTPGAIGVLNTLFTWEAEPADPAKVVNCPDDEDDPADYDTQMGWYYMVPHTLSTAAGSKASVVFSVSYNGQDPVTTTLDISDCDGTPGADTWAPNHVYNYYIKLNPGGADLRVETQDWTDVDVTTDSFIFEG